MNINSIGSSLPIKDLNPIKGRVEEPAIQKAEPTYAHDYVPLATFDQFSKGHLETLNKPLQATFRVDGVLVAAVFEGDTVVTQPNFMTLSGDDSGRLQEVREQLEGLYGDRLSIETFKSSAGITLRHFGNGDIYTDEDLQAGWTPNPTLSDQEFKQAWEKVSVYTNLENQGTLGFKTET